ncbi:Uncharacterised protein [Mycobacteroides abscessus]|nr:Uncharacterised protein [Mycobacteroides abscessus]
MKTDRPTEPPTCIAALTVALAAPASCGATPASATFCSGTRTRARPTPSTTCDGRISAAYEPSTVTRLRSSRPTAATTGPATMSGRGPTRGRSFVTTGASTRMTSVIGTEPSPARRGGSPMTTCRWNDRYSSAPIISVPTTAWSRNAPARTRSRTIRSGSSGCAVRDSTTTNATSRATPTARQASVPGAVQLCSARVSP